MNWKRWLRNIFGGAKKAESTRMTEIPKTPQSMRNYIFPKEIEFPNWSDDLRGMATEFWQKWIGPNTVGYDEAIKDLGELIDFAIQSSLGSVNNENG